MKPIACLLLIMCLLSGCTGTPKETTANQNPSTETSIPADSSTGSTTEATQEVTQATTEATQAPVLYRHPLNGKPLDTPWTGRAAAVVINNIQAALPQYGISQADMIYELETEGGITRLLAIFSDLENVGSIGPVRSARTFFNNIALSHDAVLVHCGGSEFALNGQYADNGDTIANWAHINEQYNGSYFFRDRDRYNSGYAWEHTLFTKGQELLRALDAKGYDSTYEADGYDHGLLFGEASTQGGAAANKITVTFRGKKTTTMTYDAQTGLYAASQYGQPMMDAGTNAQVQFRNVLVLYTDQWFVRDSYYARSFYELSGSGEGHFACDGQIIPITWHRDQLRGSFSYKLADGTPLTMGEGTTYVAVVAESKKPVSYE